MHGTAQSDIHPAPSSFLRRCVFSTDHKVIGRQYLGIALAWALLGGLTALLIRWQLAWPGTPLPGSDLLSADFWEGESWLARSLAHGSIESEFYNKLFTMHGTIMVFFVAMPLLLGAFGNFLVPLMVGARDMAFPRLNMLSVWTLVVASIVMLVSIFVPGGAASAGWTAYPPLSTVAQYNSPNWGQNLWLLAVAIEFASFLMGGVNLLTTVINLRAPGMTYFRLPIVVWFQGIAAILFMFSVGPLIAGAVMMLLDRLVGTGFYTPSMGGEPLVWQHLFWFFGHPEVYVIMLPGLGLALDVFAVFCRKPLYGYRVIIWASIVAGALSFIVWAHHMYLSGMDPRLAMPFSITTILISVPFAVMMFAMIATLWGASITFATPMLLALGTLLIFLLGGLTGIFLGSAPMDIYLHDTHFVVGHFHYTLFSAVFFGGFAGIYYWFPKMFGRLLDERLGKIHFWLTFIFFNAVFLPMHVVGLSGMIRRIGDPTLYAFLKPWQPANVFITVCAIFLTVGQLVFVVNFFWSRMFGQRASDNPWQSTTLEWGTSSPPPHHNYDTLPVVVRGPYEYSVPDSPQDYLPQAQAVVAGPTGRA
ncbi:MAG: cytochrome c oxidase subunit I [Candidatus Tectomicrobia bacterium]|uniref:Cytochrome c oxidase subunit I n=1 Tax=Tectimicrobiota bacterium TaxID=2528274 RepID=A0A938B3Z0_UNCTE|nr:cytochrome c oxidase subunit I [Candidatus Tectomicrobia bacterium]